MEELRLALHKHVFPAWRYRWLAVALAWLICLGGCTAVSTIPDSYEASARLYVDADSVLTPLLRGLALDNSLGNQIDVLQRTLLSRPNLEKLISKTDLVLQVGGPADLERLVGELSRNIYIVSQTRNLFTISYRNAKPQLAYDVVNSILNIFIESKTGNNRTDVDNARQFLTQQIAGYETKLRDAEGKRAAFRAKYIDLLPGDGGVSRLDTARSNVRALQGRLDDVTDRRNRLQQELAATPQTLVVETDPGTAASGGGGGNGALEAAQRHLQELLTTETDMHPDVVRQRRLIERLKAGDSGGGGGSIVPGRPARSRVQANAVYDQLKVLEVQADSDVTSLQRQVTDATSERDRLEQIARDAPGVQAQFLNLDRDYGVIQKAYDELLARRESMRLSVAADTDASKVTLKVVDPPQVPQVPSGPKRPLLLSAVLLAGLGGGVAVAVLLCQLDRSFRTVQDLRDFGLPVAGSISMLPETRRRRGWGPGLSVALPAVALLLLCSVYGGLLLRVLHRGAV